jgi:hypothetical protein
MFIAAKGIGCYEVRSRDLEKLLKIFIDVYVHYRVNGVKFNEAFKAVIPNSEDYLG